MIDLPLSRQTEKVGETAFDNARIEAPRYPSLDATEIAAGQEKSMFCRQYGQLFPNGVLGQAEMNVVGEEE